MAYAHVHCLNTWRSSSDSMRDKCEVCGFKFITRKPEWIVFLERTVSFDGIVNIMMGLFMAVLVSVVVAAMLKYRTLTDAEYSNEKSSYENPNSLYLITHSSFGLLIIALLLRGQCAFDDWYEIVKAWSLSLAMIMTHGFHNNSTVFGFVALVFCTVSMMLHISTVFPHVLEAVTEIEGCLRIMLRKASMGAVQPVQ